LTCKKAFENLADIIEDKRKDYLIKYPMAVIIIEAILVHLLNTGSRHNINYKLQHKNIIDAVNKFTNTELETFSHGDNVEKIFKKLSVKELQEFLSTIMTDVIRSKKIKPKDMLFGEYYMIAIDMTQTQKLTIDELNGKKIEGLLYQDNNGTITYSRKVVEAKLLLFNKLSLPLMSEFVRNDDTVDGVFIKQDCELKAAYRLMDKIKKRWPKLKICLLLDGLYPNKTIFEKCKKFKWKYIITLKDDKIPTLFKKFKEFKKLNYFNEKKKIVSASLNQRFKFVDLEYCSHELTIVEMKEYEQDSEKKYHNIFVTNIEVSKDNVYYVGRAGRLRWKIEHSFNKQKNLLFTLKHVYSKNENSSQCYHIILQITDLIFQFMAYTLTVDGENVLYELYGSLINFLSEIYISFRADISEIENYFLVRHIILIQPKP